MKIVLDDIPKEVRGALVRLIDSDEDGVVTEAVSLGIVVDECPDFTSVDSCHNYLVAVAGHLRTPTEEEMEEVPGWVIIRLMGLKRSFAPVFREMVHKGLGRLVSEAVGLRRMASQEEMAKAICSDLFAELEEGLYADTVEVLTPLFPLLTTHDWKVTREHMHGVAVNGEEDFKIRNLVESASNLRRRKGVSKAVQTKASGDTTPDALVNAIRSGKCPRILKFNLGGIDQKRFDKVKEEWLNGIPKIRCMMLALPESLTEPYREDLLNTLLDLPVATCRMICQHVKVFLLQKEYEGLTLERRIRLLELMCLQDNVQTQYGITTSHLSTMLTAARLRGLPSEKIRRWYGISWLVEMSGVDYVLDTQQTVEDFQKAFGDDLGRALFLLGDFESDPMKLCEVVRSLPAKKRKRAAQMLLHGASVNSGDGWAILRRLLP